MKFLCPNCKAKYQIADEKIGGRTLKMDCRKCGHSIVIRADGTEGGASSMPPAQSLHGVSLHGVSMHGVSMHGASQPAEAPRSWPSAPLSRAASTPSQPRLSARTSTSQVGQNPSGPSRVPARPTSRSIHPGSARPIVLEQWHVAINDVPVGPMKRDEIARKIAQGAVRGESLAWREGFDDWRPLRDIPELSSLLRESLPSNRSAPPPPPRTAGISSSAHASTSRGSGSSITGSSSSPLALVASSAADADAHAEEPTMLAGMNFGANALAPLRISEAPPVHEDDGLPPLVGSVAPSHSNGDSLRVSGEMLLRPPNASAPPAQLLVDPKAEQAKMAAPLVPSQAPRSESKAKAKPQVQTSVPLLFALATCIPFSMVFAWKLGDHLFRSDNAQAHGQTGIAEAVATVAETVTAPAPREVVPSLELAAAAAPTALPVAATATATANPNTAAAQRNRRNGGGTGTGTGTAAPTTVPVAAANPAFDRFRDEGGGGPARLATQVADHSNDGPSRSSSELTAEQINTVVRREQRNLQSCYLLELRRAGGSSETIRVNMSLTIGSSGAVTAARAQGPSFGNLSECLERSVRRWRFPTSAEGGETAFPLVLSPGA